MDAKDKSLVLDMKSEPNVDSITDIACTKAEGDYLGNNTDIQVGAAKPEHKNEIFPYIKLEEIYIKEETSSIISQPSGSKQRVDLPFKCAIKQSFDKILQKHTQSFLMSKKKTPFTDPKKACQRQQFQYNIYQYKTNDRVNLQQHMITHIEEKPFACSFCEHKSAWKNNITEHMKIHTGEKPFSCNLCEYKTAYKRALIAHMRIHTGEKPYKCNICEFKAKRKDTLHVHMKIHMGRKPEKKFECNLCPFKASYKSDLNIHMRAHVGEKKEEPFVCIFCKFTTARKVALANHIKIHSDEKAL